MKKLFMFALFGFVAVALTMLPESALAVASDYTTSGSSLKADITGMLGGTVGTVIGLLLAIFGLYMWLVQQASWGIVLILGGVLITVFPSIFTGVKDTVTTNFGDSIN